MTPTTVERRAAPPRKAPLRRDGRAAAGFLAPWFVGLAVITAGPLVASLYLSFTDFDLLSPARWIGLDNYVQMFQDPRWLTSLGVTATFVAVSVPLQLAFALALALFLDKGLRGLSFYRSLYYLPSLLGGSVAIAYAVSRGAFVVVAGGNGFEEGNAALR